MMTLLATGGPGYGSAAAADGGGGRGGDVAVSLLRSNDRGSVVGIS